MLNETNPFEIDKCKSKNGASVSEYNFCLTAFQVDKYDWPCLQSKVCQYLKGRPDI